MKTKLVIGGVVVALAALGYYLFRIRRRTPGGQIGIEVCSTQGSAGCSSDWSDTGGRPPWLDLIDPYPNVGGGLGSISTIDKPPEHDGWSL